MTQNLIISGLLSVILALMYQCGIFQKESYDSSMSYDEYPLQAGSSVWCRGVNHTQRTCRFTNLCYVHKEHLFIFFHGEQTVISGLPTDRFSPALLDLSSIEDHNAQYFNFEDVPAHSTSHIFPERPRFINKTSLLFSRFYPDNVMHVFHDDLIPAFHTLWQIHGSHSRFDALLVFTDNMSNDSFEDLYSRFTIQSPLYLSDLKEDICFRDAYVGVSKDSTWYDYGFTKPQRKKSSLTVNSQTIRQFTKLFNNPVRDISSREEEIIVLVSRKHTRLILNELDLCTKLAFQFHMKVESVSMETHTLDEIVNLFTRAKVVVGMHGSMLIFALFMQPGTLLVELFPYAVPPENYTPYKTLTEISGMYIMYRSWRNFDKSKTVAHPDDPPDLGGINHLPEVLRKEIISSDEVTPHLCCSDPHWLYRIFQDTDVNIDEIVSLIRDGLDEANNKMENISTLEQSLAPGKVKDLSCQTGCRSNLDFVSGDTACLNISWQEPWNVKYLKTNESDLEYEVWVQAISEDGYHSYKIRATSLYLDDLPYSDTYNIWIHTFMSRQKGPYVYMSCSGS